jgi:hypothetical protein
VLFAAETLRTPGVPSEALMYCSSLKIVHVCAHGVGGAGGVQEGEVWRQRLWRS